MTEIMHIAEVAGTTSRSIYGLAHAAVCVDPREDT